jgi:hypothetical protein
MVAGGIRPAWPSNAPEVHANRESLQPIRPSVGSVGTAIVIVILIVVVLLFIGLSTIWMTRRVERAQGRDTCAFCGAALEAVGMEYTTHCTACGRQQPWDTDPPVS